MNQEYGLHNNEAGKYEKCKVIEFYFSFTLLIVLSCIFIINFWQLYFLAAIAL